MTLELAVISLMPEMFAAMDYGVTGRAIEENLLRLQLFNPRDWGLRGYRQVDDKAYGGGPGMVMMYPPLKAAIDAARASMPESAKLIYLSPQGRTLRQAELNDLAQRRQPLIFLAGRYEGVDERVIQRSVDEEWSLGDFVLSGGELPAMVYMDALIRLLPGALGDAQSAEQDSFMQGLLDCPHYTRPVEVDGMRVPAVLMNGNHRDIARWRRKQALGRTWQRRPELVAIQSLSADDQALLKEYQGELSASNTVDDFQAE